MVRHQLDVAFGCASVGINDGGHRAANLWHDLRQSHLASPERRVRPLRPLPLPTSPGEAAVQTPALIRGYLRCGAEFLGPPALDSAFQTADFPMLMTLAGLPQRHKRHLLPSAVKELALATT